ncbi:MAG: hypothetical protein H7245_08255 [Candidatus Saccharibacteria bacterium]|nr:hypothetical protein [Pseudorhodobacter sp.]
MQGRALTIAISAITLIFTATFVIQGLTDLDLEPVLFEVVCAFSTVGLSTGITASLPPSALIVLIILMFVGSVRTIAVATALALRHGARPYRYPEERPIVGQEQDKRSGCGRSVRSGPLWRGGRLIADAAWA